MRIKNVTEPIPGVIHLHFENQYDVCSTFMRMQEFYESPYENIKGRYFSVEHYMDTYADDTGNFTYTSDWSGMNVPGDIVTKFFGMFALFETYDGATLMDKEQDLKTILLPFMDKYGEDFYVIGTYKEETIDHELAHAMYYLQPNYKWTMDNLTNQIRRSCAMDIYNALMDKGYCEEVMMDELQAYLATSSYRYLFKNFNTINFPWLMVNQYRESFKAAREKYRE